MQDDGKPIVSLLEFLGFSETSKMMYPDCMLVSLWRHNKVNIHIQVVTDAKLKQEVQKILLQEYMVNTNVRNILQNGNNTEQAAFQRGIDYAKNLQWPKP